MDTALVPNPSPRSRRVLGAIVGAVVVAALGGVALWTTTCPCERAPGFWLFGDLQAEPVGDWTFANEVPLCQLQVRAGGLPHAINLNCMATPAGELYLSCSRCDGKRWSTAVATQPAARLRLGQAVYPVTVTRATVAAALDAAWVARAGKLRALRGGDDDSAANAPAPRPDHWWTFRVTSAAARGS